MLYTRNPASSLKRAADSQGDVAGSGERLMTCRYGAVSVATGSTPATASGDARATAYDCDAHL